jgi:hypothetical protein
MSSTITSFLERPYPTGEGVALPFPGSVHDANARSNTTATVSTNGRAENLERGGEPVRPKVYLGSMA